MLDKRNKYIIRDKIRRSILIKYKYITIIQKSMFHNRYLSKKNRIFFFFYLNTNRLSSKKIKNICNISGEHKAVNKKLLLTRFQINYSSILNKLQNFKINSW